MIERSLLDIWRFNDIDEFLKLTDEEEYNLIQVGNDLVKTLYQLKSAKYEPFVKYQLGMLSEIKVRLRFKKLKKQSYII